MDDEGDFCEEPFRDSDRLTEFDEELPVLGTKRGRKAKPKPSDGFSKYASSDMIEFIEIVESHPVIWDKSCDNGHRTNDLHLRIFDGIEEQCKRFMPRGKNTHGSVAKKIWAELMKAYDAFTVAAQKSKSGSAASTKSSFPYAQYMTFLDGAKHKRQVNNAYIIGSEEYRILESFESVENDFSENIENFEKTLTMETPKRKHQSDKYATPKRAKISTKKHDLLEKLEQSNKEFSETLKNAFGALDTTSCQSERICKVFAQKTNGWEDADRFMAEAEVLNFIKSLQNPGHQQNPGTSQIQMRQSQIPHSSHFFVNSDPNVPSTSTYGPQDPSNISLFSDPYDDYYGYQ